MIEQSEVTWLPVAFFLLLIFVIGVLFVANKVSGRGWVVLLGGGFLMMAFLWIRLASVSPERVNSYLVRTDQAGAEARDASIEAMWKHLNRNRIDLKESSDKKAGVNEADKLFKSEKTQQDQPKQPRPKWVDLPPKRIGNVYRVVVSSGPYRDTEECHRAIEPELQDIVLQRVKQLAGGYPLDSLSQIGIGTDYILRDICRSEWGEQTEASFGAMQQVHVLMEFDAGVDKHLSQTFQNYHRKYRVKSVKKIVATCLFVLVTLYGLLKFDTYTRGYYTKRLFFGVPAVIIAVVALLN